MPPHAAKPVHGRCIETAFYRERLGALRRAASAPRRASSCAACWAARWASTSARRWLAGACVLLVGRRVAPSQRFCLAAVATGRDRLPAPPAWSDAC
jgi:hypothetical protein